MEYPYIIFIHPKVFERSMDHTLFVHNAYIMQTKVECGVCHTKLIRSSIYGTHCYDN